MEEEKIGTQVEDERTDEYYPSAMATRADTKHDVLALETIGSRAKQEVDLSKLNLLLKSSAIEYVSPLSSQRPLSVIQIYSPTFKGRSSICNMFEQDSGIGVDITI